MLRPSPRRSFYVVVAPTDKKREWYWEIHRKRRPMGVELRESGFPSQRSAMLAGRDALEELLNGLSLDPVSLAHPERGVGMEIARLRHRAMRK